MWYDEENHNYVQMESTVDKEKNTVSCDTTHFSVYTLINGAEWNKFWNTPIQYHFLNYRDIAVVCENTEEMWDYVNATVTMADNVANNMRKGDHICEIEYGTDACVEFDFGQETEFSFQKANVDWEDAIYFDAECNWNQCCPWSRPL